MTEPSGLLLNSRYSCFLQHIQTVQKEPQSVVMINPDIMLSSRRQAHSWATATAEETHLGFKR